MDAIFGRRSPTRRPRSTIPPCTAQPPNRLPTRAAERRSAVSDLRVERRQVLAVVDELLGDRPLAVEGHVPGEGPVPRGRKLRAGRRIVQTNVRPHLPGELRDVLESDPAAEVVRNQVEGAQPDPVAQQLLDVPRQGLLVEARRASGAVAEAGEVEGVDSVPLGQGRHDLPPLVPGLRPAVQQHQRRALPPVT